MTGNEDMNEAAEGRDSNGYTKDEHAIYYRIKEDTTKYFFLQVLTVEVQETIDSVRNETVHFATMTAWTKSNETEAAAAACAAAVALVPTITPDTMDALIEKKTTAVSEKIAKKAAVKAIDRHIAQKFGRVKTCWSVERPNPPSPRKAPARNQKVDPTARSSTERSEKSSTVQTVLAKSAKPNSSSKPSKNYPSPDPNSV
jgi:hypothetical protein